MQFQVPARAFARLFFSCAFMATAGWGASACEGLDVGASLFDVDWDVHSLCVIAGGDDASAQAIHEELASWKKTEAANLNVKVEFVAADDPGVFWEDYGLLAVPDDLPLTVLVARHRAGKRAFVVDRWEPGPTAEDLAALLDSPLRKRIRLDVPLHKAVLLYAPPTGQEPDAHRTMLDGIVAARAKQQEKISLVRLERPAPEERTLLAFLGIPERGPAWLGVIAGRGKLLFPPMKGEDITEAKIAQLLDILSQPCTCIADPASLGVDLLMKWGDYEKDLISSLAEAAYSETVVGGGNATPPPIEIPVENPPILIVAMSVLAGLALVAAAMVVLGVWRRHRRVASWE